MNCPPPDEFQIAQGVEDMGTASATWDENTRLPPELPTLH